MVCDKVVCVSVWRRRREEEEAGRRPGIENQKQEPHTKLWRTNLTVTLSSAIFAIVRNFYI